MTTRPSCASMPAWSGAIGHPVPRITHADHLQAGPRDRRPSADSVLGPVMRSVPAGTRRSSGSVRGSAADRPASSWQCRRGAGSRSWAGPLAGPRSLGRLAREPGAAARPSVGDLCGQYRLRRLVRAGHGPFRRRAGRVHRDRATTAPGRIRPCPVHGISAVSARAGISTSSSPAASSAAPSSQAWALRWQADPWL
jgi:hypothetical protein